MLPSYLHDTQGLGHSRELREKGGQEGPCGVLSLGRGVGPSPCRAWSHPEGPGGHGLYDPLEVSGLGVRCKGS